MSASGGGATDGIGIGIEALVWNEIAGKGVAVGERPDWGACKYRLPLWA